MPINKTHTHSLYIWVRVVTCIPERGEEGQTVGGEEGEDEGEEDALRKQKHEGEEGCDEESFF